MTDDANDGADAPSEEDRIVATLDPARQHGEVVTMQELVNRCVAQAHKFGEQSHTRILLLNVARAIVELTVSLDGANQKIASYEAAQQRSKLVLLPGQGEANGILGGM